MGVYVSQVEGSTSGVASYLDNGWSSISLKADEAFNAAMNLANGVISLTYSPEFVDPGVPTIPGGIGISTAGLGVAPTIGAFTGTIPADPTLTAVSYTPGDAPDFSTLAPSIVFPAQPTVTTPAALGDAPTVSSVVLPADPTIVLPDVPTMRSFNLPDAPEIILPVFAGTDPSGDVPELAQPNFIWEEAAYSPHLAALADKISALLAFDYDAAETAIWERGQERNDRATNLAVLALIEDYASRNLALPSGAMLAATNELRAKGAEFKTDNAREAMIKAAEVNREKLSLAIQSGVQYEGMWMNYQTQYMQRAFEAAKAVVDIAFNMLDAKISLFNARLQAYQTAAQVHRDLIQAQLLTLEAYKAELEGKKLINQLNMQDVELYRAQLQGSIAVIDLYKARVEAVVSTIEVDKARIQGFTAEVAAYKARIDANLAEYTAWGEAMRGEAVKAQVYETEVRAFASRVDAYKSQETVGIEAAKLTLEKNKQEVDKFSALLNAFDSQIKAYAAGVDAEVRGYGAEVNGYQATMAAREAEAKIQLGVVAAEADIYRAQVSANVEKVRAGIQLLQSDVQLLLGKMQSAGQILSQLAASSMSALNFSVGSSESFQLGVQNSLNENHNYTGA